MANQQQGSLEALELESATGQATIGEQGRGGRAPGASKRRSRGAAAAASADADASAASDLRSHLREFIGEHPHGWEHHDWMHLLDRLRERGHDTADADGIGRELERERVLSRLVQVPGVGPQRAKSIVDCYGTLWDLRHAEVDDLARAARIPRPLAEKVKSAV